MPRHTDKMNVKQIANDIFLPEVISIIDEGHTVTIPLRGYSMRPFLEDGRDKAVLRAPDSIKKGDIVLANIAEGKYVLHRIVETNNDHITLLGDGNITPEHCFRHNIKAVAIGFYRKGRTKMDRTDGHKWRAYSWVWTHARPIRRYLLYIYRHIFINKQR